MCGISGFVGFNSQSVRERTHILRTLGSWLIHRGPDAWGEYVDQEIALGHNRLAILDLHTGQQPMLSSCGNVVVIFNGEIYNHVLLRKELISLGQNFKTDHSDTEVILCGFLQWGQDVFEKLNGMFSIAIWDKRCRSLMLARDRIGIKPLYFAYLSNGGLVFASEPKAIVGSGLVKAEIRVDGLAEYFLFRAPARSESMFRNIQKLEPGGLLTRSPDGNTTQRKFFSVKPAVPFLSDGDAVRSVEFTLTRVIKSQISADVPVGLFLSGGVDSGIATALAARERAVDCFTVGTASELDETKFAERVAGHVHAELHVRNVNASNFLSHMGDWEYVNDDPCADPSALALLLLSQFARESGMKVMLAGEGSDEVFGGYNAYSRFVAINSLRRIPGYTSFARIFGNFISPKSRDYVFSDRPRNYLGTSHLTDLMTLRRLLSSTLSDSIDDVLSFCNSQTIHPSAVRTAMEFDKAVRLPDDLLMRTDRATMYYSIEARVPFLDNEVVDCAARLSDSQCLGFFGLSRKRILKTVAQKFIPRSVIYRSKRGFDLPIGNWLREQFLPLLHDYVRKENVPGIQYDTLRSLLKRLEMGVDTDVGLIWAWFVLERWYDKWITRCSSPQTPENIKHLDGYKFFSTHAKSLSRNDATRWRL
jgi:asparagine synthase (glutamine-hydrolysing)